VHIERPVANLAVVVRSKGANREREPPQEVVMKISEVMTAKPQVIKASESVLKAAELLARDNIGALPVERDDRLIGMLTDRDIVVRVVAGGKDPAKTKVLDVVSDPLRYCYEDEDVKHVAENMHQLLVRRLPVMNRDKRLVGIVSIDDLEPRKH
jgi:CBS domain-containing protein